MTVCVIVVAVTIVTLLSLLFVLNAEHKKSDQTLLLLCETGERNLDYYFNSVEKSVGKVSSYVQEDLDGLEEDKLAKHMERVRKYFDEMAYRTNGVLTYYYRVDPEVSTKVKGFWYTNLDREGFVEHEPTDISKYDTQDTSRLVWFTVPKHTGEPIWLPPYITDNLDVRVLSYNVPIYYRDKFVGVVGIEIDYSTMAEQVESIRLYTNGYSFITDRNGNLVFHPHIDVAEMTEESKPKPPTGLLNDTSFVQYTFEDKQKQGVWLPLSNDMKIYVAVPREEIYGDWWKLIVEVIVASVIVLLLLSFYTMRYTKRITKPLEDLTAAAEQVNRGNYDLSLDYDGDDEVGRLTSTFKRLAGHMKEHINDLNNRVYVDALTHVRNKGAYADIIEELQEEMNTNHDDMEFAVGVFDCDDLKAVNDNYGHERGDVYLQTASRLICRVFKHSPVFRIGGDEFSVILRNEDYVNRDELIRQFKKEEDEISISKENVWEQVHVTVGVSVFDPERDNAVIDVVRRADKAMYENKNKKKQTRNRT
jgi:diguanylate cyclase (GGDEF)-like protein